MLIIGCDYHPSMQQIAFLDTETGEQGERRLMHCEGEAERFYRELQRREVKVRVGMEATGYAHWFERLLAELGFEFWIGEPAKIRARRVRKQKTDRRDAQLLLQLLQEEDGFPRVWMPNPENRDLRQLLWHRHRLAQMRTRIMNQLQAVALNEGLRRKRGLWSQAGRKQLELFLPAPWASRRRQDLLELLDGLNPRIEELTAAVEKEGEKPEVQRLMTHPGVGPLTALAFVLIIGTPQRFHCGKQMGSYLGLIPSEDSRANRQRFGHISKQGSSLLRYLLVEATQVTVRVNPEWRRRFVHLAMRRGRKIAKVAMARRLAVALYWMWHKQSDYQQVLKFGSHVGELEFRHGVQSITA